MRPKSTQSLEAVHEVLNLNHKLAGEKQQKCSSNNKEVTSYIHLKPHIKSTLEITAGTQDFFNEKSSS